MPVVYIPKSSYDKIIQSGKDPTPFVQEAVAKALEKLETELEPIE